MKAVLITGASTGIGKATALYLDARGYRVFAGIRKQSDAQQLQKEASSRLIPVTIDITKQETIDATAALIKETVKDVGLWGLVNNAGLVFVNALEYLPMEDLRMQWEVNLFGHLAVTQALLPLLHKAEGRIIFMGSIVGRISLPFISSYTASKHAMRAYADALRMELYCRKVKVSIIEPGVIKTPMWNKASKNADLFLQADKDDVYAPAFSFIKDFTAHHTRSAPVPESTARIVDKALRAKRPKENYVPGLEGFLLNAMLLLLPKRLYQWFIMKKIWNKANVTSSSG